MNLTILKTSNTLRPVIFRMSFKISEKSLLVHLKKRKCLVAWVDLRTGRLSTSLRFIGYLQTIERIFLKPNFSYFFNIYGQQLQIPTCNHELLQISFYLYYLSMLCAVVSVIETKFCILKMIFIKAPQRKGPPKCSFYWFLLVHNIF